MKRRLLPALAAAVLTVTVLTGCEAIKTRRVEQQQRKDEAARIAEREFLESFADDYAAWLKDWESYQSTLPEPPLPAAGAD